MKALEALVTLEVVDAAVAEVETKVRANLEGAATQGANVEVASNAIGM